MKARNKVQQNEKINSNFGEKWNKQNPQNKQKTRKKKTEAQNKRMECIQQ